MAVPVDAEESLAAKFATLFPHLDERQRRLVMGAEARGLGHGGIKVVAAAADVSAVTVSRGVAELEGGGEPLGRARRPGGGRKRVAGTDPGLKDALLALVDPESRGDPESPLRWTTKSTRHLAAALTAAGHQVSAPTVAALLKEESFSLQGNAKTLEGARPADSDAQFRYINGQARDHIDAGEPVISVDAKKKENAGPFRKNGREWQPAGAPEPVNVHRQPAAAVLTAVALRPRQTPERLAITLERAHRSAAVTRVDLGALTLDEARQLLGERFDVARAALLYQESGGNPFYLEQLARSPARAPGFTAAAEISLTGLDVPAAVAASLAEELTLLSAVGRLVLEGAAVAGDPFEPELAAAAAATSEAAGMHAVDELLGLDLIRTTDVPRRFRFRHPLVRRAVYEATAGGWWLGAHERCAEALAARGASAAARAHHVERSAREGDLAAVAVLREAGQATARLAPESAARWFGGALRLLPQTAPAKDRVELLLARSQSLAAVGRFTGSHEAALEAVALVPGQPSALTTTVATACASVERFLGRYEHAHARLVRALRLLPSRPRPSAPSC